MEDGGLRHSIGDKMREVVARNYGARTEAATVHSHGEPTREQRIAGDAARVLISEELDPGHSELIARKLHAKLGEIGPIFGYMYGLDPCPWERMPMRERAWIVATVAELIKDGVIRSGDAA